MLYGNNDWRDYLEHSWGTKPHQKKREKEYNAWYYQEHKDEILAKRKKNRPLSRQKNVTGSATVSLRGSDNSKYHTDKRYMELLAEIKSGGPHNDVDEDLGEFLAEYGSTNKNVTEADIQMWVAFRKELGKSTSIERINLEKKEVESRNDTGKIGLAKKENNQKSNAEYMSELITTYARKSSQEKRDQSNAIFDYGEFLAELGENGAKISDPNDRSLKKLWKEFRKENGVATSSSDLTEEIEKLKKNVRLHENKRR